MPQTLFSSFVKKINKHKIDRGLEFPISNRTRFDERDVN
jgi:hypothetical protein